MTHVNVLQTLALEHGELTDLMQQQDVACVVLAPARNQTNTIIAWCNVVVLFNLAIKKELIENLFSNFNHVPLQRVGCYNLYFVSGECSYACF